MYEDYDDFDNGYGGNDFDEYSDWDATDCANGDYNTWEENEVFQDHEGDEFSDPVPSCANGEHEYLFDGYCGAYVCVNCDDHMSLARCYCGWSASGGDGRAELEDMGEVIDDPDAGWDDLGYEGEYDWCDW